MFGLPDLTDLSKRAALTIREVERIGADLRVLARVTSSEKR
jgi:hypothetical protein